MDGVRFMGGYRWINGCIRMCRVGVDRWMGGLLKVGGCRLMGGYM